MASVYERITNALSSLGKRRERDNGDGGQNAGSNSRQPKRFRPWDQADLHQRLESYKPLTWFAKPDTVGPVPCALRGWVNDGTDSLSCDHCNAKLVYPPNVPYDQRQAAADLFSPSLTTKHTRSCPWHGVKCDFSVLAYKPTSSNDELTQLFQTLQGKLLKVDVLPDLDAVTLQVIRDAAAPYGSSYEDLVLGATAPAGGGAAPSQRRTQGLRIVDVTENPEADATDAASEAAAALATTPSAGGGGGPTYVLQPSKLTPQQKARLLALLGWDIDVLQPDSASGSAALPYTQSAGYSLQHLGVKPKSASKVPSASFSTAAAAGSSSPPARTAMTTTAASPSAAVVTKAAAADRERHPMSSVVLKCPHCNSRTGLWNFAGLRPVPSGRLTPAQPTGGAAALLTPFTAAGGGAGGDAGALSMTIAGGQYGLHGIGASARPFGSAASAAPFRFGAAGSTEPVFGIAALEPDVTAKRGGFGSPIRGGGVAAAAVTPGGATAAGRHGGGGASLAGTKRKAEDGGTPEPMAVDAAGWRTPGGAGVADGKRPRLQGGASPLPGPLGLGQTPGGAGGDPQQIRELNPLRQHRSWCPWVYTGTAEEPTMSGWQHMLQALSSKRQQELEAAAAAAAEAGGPTAMDAEPGTAAAPAAATAMQLRDKAVAAIRSL